MNQEAGIDWLGVHLDAEEDLDSYEVFVEDVNTVIMGWNIYRQGQNSSYRWRESMRFLSAMRLLTEVVKKRQYLFCKGSVKVLVRTQRENERLSGFVAVRLLCSSWCGRI